MTLSNDSQNRLEQLSSLLDEPSVRSEDADSALNELLSDDESHEAWYRYNLVSSVLKQEHSAFSSYDFTHSISALIKEEPSIVAFPEQTILASDKNANHSAGLNSQVSNVVSLWRRAGGGLAIAASVAFVMVFSVQMMNSGTDTTLVNGLDSAKVDNGTQLSTPHQSESEVAEQARLDEIQFMLDKMNQNRLNANEQLVDGEVIFSKVVRPNNMNSLERQVRNMKKPSEKKEQ